MECVAYSEYAEIQVVTSEGCHYSSQGMRSHLILKTKKGKTEVIGIAKVTWLVSVK